MAPKINFLKYRIKIKLNRPVLENKSKYVNIWSGIDLNSKRLPDGSFEIFR